MHWLIVALCVWGVLSVVSILILLFLVFRNDQPISDGEPWEDPHSHSDQSVDHQAEDAAPAGE